MKFKIYRHLLFWLVCNLQNTLLEYAWIHSTFSYRDDIINMAIAFNLSLLPSRIFFVYYALDLVVNQAIKKRKELTPIVIKLGIALCIAILMHRAGSVYVINAMEYPQDPVLFKNIFRFSAMFVSLLDLGYASAIAVALTLFRMQIINLKNEKNLIKDKLETELKFLKNQINPHFLFNTLNNIYALARKKSDKTPEVVMRLSKLLRFMLYESSKASIPISEEIQILEDYLQLEKIRYSRLELFFDKQIDDFSEPIAPLILLPFIENAFKHGVNETVDSTWIDINLSLNNGLLFFRVKNNHDKAEDEAINENIGLTNVRRQLELMYTDFTLKACYTASQFIVDLNINLKTHGKI